MPVQSPVLDQYGHISTRLKRSREDVARTYNGGRAGPAARRNKRTRHPCSARVRVPPLDGTPGILPHRHIILPYQHTACRTYVRKEHGTASARQVSSYGRHRPCRDLPCNSFGASNSVMASQSTRPWCKSAAVAAHQTPGLSPLVTVTAYRPSELPAHRPSPT